MKNIRLYLTQLAFFTAIGAGAINANNITNGFYFVFIPQLNQPACIASSQECNGPGAICRDFDSRIIYDNNIVNGTSCGVALQMSNN